MWVMDIYVHNIYIRIIVLIIRTILLFKASRRVLLKKKREMVFVSSSSWLPPPHVNSFSCTPCYPLNFQVHHLCARRSKPQELHAKSSISLWTPRQVVSPSQLHLCQSPCALVCLLSFCVRLCHVIDCVSRLVESLLPVIILAREVVFYVDFNVSFDPLKLNLK